MYFKCTNFCEQKLSRFLNFFGKVYTFENAKQSNSRKFMLPKNKIFLDPRNFMHAKKMTKNQCFAFDIFNNVISEAIWLVPIAYILALFIFVLFVEKHFENSNVLKALGSTLVFSFILLAETINSNIKNVFWLFWGQKVVPRV